MGWTRRLKAEAANSWPRTSRLHPDPFSPVKIRSRRRQNRFTATNPRFTARFLDPASSPRSGLECRVQPAATSWLFKSCCMCPLQFSRRPPSVANGAVSIEYCIRFKSKSISILGESSWSWQLQSHKLITGGRGGGVGSFKMSIRCFV